MEVSVILTAIVVAVRSLPAFGSSSVAVGSVHCRRVAVRAR